MKLALFCILVASAIAGETSKFEQSANYVKIPVVEFHYQIQTRKITDIKKYKGKIFKVEFERKKRPQAIYDAALLYSSKYGSKHALFMATGSYRGRAMSLQVIFEIDPDGLYMKSSRVDEGYYKLRGVETYKTVAGGDNTVFIFDKYTPPIEKAK